ncbi:LuxR family transcriptional regulator [Streptomyces oceani]|uniref:LuxR family transcriptional regulator n=1 Tax=Streptomyces oceani TaxID=1075402 RepID=A0A1E7KJP8_9ACTN|nr:LuxR family transcriptional regulator [Streptomyces oceani]OEV04222.1 LuxR family transcriptional regulator [Streptomyces oceani]
MRVTDLNTQADERMARASASSAGRAAVTVHGGGGSVLRQALIALKGGRGLAEHENPGEATVLVLRGHVRLSSGDDAAEGGDGALLTVPQARHSLEALEDSAILLSVANQPDPGNP